MPHERRHFVRVGKKTPAMLTTATAAFSVHVLDLSLKGALIMVPAQPALGPGTLCQLTIPLTYTCNHIAMSTDVAHLLCLHSVLLCKGIDLDSVTHLRRLIELQLGDSALLEWDLGELRRAGAAH